MLSIKLHIKNCDNYEYIHKKQQNYSGAFRYIYKHIHNLDDENVVFIKTKFNLNEIEYRSVKEEVSTKFNQIKTNKNKLIDEIIDISDEIKELNEQPKTKKITRRLFKLNKKLQYKNKSLSKDITFGGLYNLRKISYLSNNKIDNEQLLNKYKLIYNDNRLLGTYLIGEANQKGNRFFDFDLNNNIIYYKPIKGVKIKFELNKYNSYRNTLLVLQHLIEDKDISVTVRITKKHLTLIFDEERLSGYSINIKERTKEVNEIKLKGFDKDYQTSLIKDVYVKFYEENRKLKLSNKLSNRYFGIDTNPDYIGCSILDRIGDDYKIVKTFYYDLTFLNDVKHHKLNNKRKHGLTHIWKNIFRTFAYYKCGYFVHEELELKSKDLGVKEANRKINNLWYRTLSENLTNKYCNKLGIIKIGINPCYSSFIGNIMYDYVDPVNASIEICRRGMFKYDKKENNISKFYPILDTGTIMDTVLLRNAASDVSFLKDSSSWVDSYQKIRKSGLRYRATMDDCKRPFNDVYNLSHSNICKRVFY